MTRAERWLPIPGADDYTVSDQGNVRSASGPLKGSRGGSGYRTVYLRRNDGPAIESVHALVLLAFVGPCPACWEIRHLDGNRTNNSLENLRYGSRSENALDRVRHGNDVNARKTACPQGHPYDTANTYVMVEARGARRCCRECNRQAVARRRTRIRMSVGAS